MITSILSYGLGNRMIFIANVYVHHLRKNVECKFFDKYSHQIDHHINYYYKNNIFSKLDFEYCYFDDKSDIFSHCKSNTYNEILKDVSENTMLNIIKYDDIEKYHDNFIITDFVVYYPVFFNYKKELYDLFVNDDIINELKNRYKNILNNSIAIHVRRSDFVWRYPQIVKSIDFYLDSIKKIEKEKKIDNILIFSDDIQWCKKNFNDNRIFFVEGQTDYEDMYLMSLCENFIYNSSSFAWWGVIFNKNDNKKVIDTNRWLSNIDLINNTKF
jgi:hypothetical protein